MSSYFFSYIAPLIPHMIAVAFCYFLYKALVEVFLGEIPSSPAAIGRSLGILVLGQLVCFYLLWYFSYALSLVSIVHIDSYHSVLYVPIGLLFSITSGYLATRTFEYTGSMNVKIVCAIGLLPQGLITIATMTAGLSTSITFFLFIPCVLIGCFLSKYTPNKAIKQD